MNRLRVGIAGLGRMGRRHAENLARRVPNAELVAACDPGADELGWAERQLGVAHCYADYAAMLAQPDLEAVSADKPEHFFLERYRAAYAAEMGHFFEVLAGRAMPRTSIDDGVKALALAEAATTSWREKRIVES